MSLKLGSLFDGSGGFPLAGMLCGVEPRWASEVEPYPIAVTRSRFPQMKHLGDISTVNGADIEPVDIITFGSPCQDLSVAGKRAGLKHEANGDEETTRSGLFMEAVRIIKEMKEATNGEYPRFALWENVPGAFSSNKGEDFRIVLEELIKIVEPTATMPAVPKNGWPYADSYVGDGWSIAYRVFDAQYWGVPQRRRRIHLVADIRGTSAREVLFERAGVRGYFTEGGTPWESLTAYAEGGVGADDREGECAETPAALKVYGIDHAITTGGNCTAQGPCVYEDVQATLKAAGPHSVAYTLKIRSGCEGGGKGALIQTDKSATLSTLNDQYLFQPEVIAVATQQGGAEISEDGISPTVTASAGMSGNNQPWICHAVDENILDDQGGQQISVRSDGKVPTLRAEMHGNIPCVMEAAGFKELNSAEARSIGYSHEVAPTLSAGKHDASVCVKSWDARGNGDGDTVSTITGDHENRITDYSSVVVQPAVFDGANVTCPTNASNPLPGDPCHTLSTDSRNWLVEPVCCIDGDKIGKAERAGGSGLGIRDGDKMYTLTAKDVHGVCLPINDKATRWQGGGASRKEDGAGNGFGVGQEGDPSPTLTSGDRHAVAYAMQGFGDYKESDVASGIKARDYKDATDLVTEGPPVALDRAFYNQGQNALYDPQFYEDGTVPTLVARGPAAVAIRYIVRRLTPTECARLQGFADCWSEIEEKESLTDEEWTFWAGVRNTHAAINGKAVKSYTEAQMLTWYNKLHTDSAEYKMWGNGIALPPALYCMQGMTDVLERERYNFATN